MTFTELTFTILKYALLLALWVFAWLAVHSLRKDIHALSPKLSRSRRIRKRKAQQLQLPQAAVCANPNANPANPTASANLADDAGMVNELAAVSTPVASSASASPESPVVPANSAAAMQAAEGEEPTMLVVIDGPLAGTSAPLTDEPVTIGRSASNTVVIDDEFVSSHHARVYRDPYSHAWAIEDLGSTNGTMLDQYRLDQPTILPARIPVRIGATTFELR